MDLHHGAAGSSWNVKAWLWRWSGRSRLAGGGGGGSDGCISL
jgi:hypothetical protein